MLFLKYMLMITGFGLLTGAGAILVLDLYEVLKGRRHMPEVKWNPAGKSAGLALIPLLLGIAITVVPSGTAGVRVNQFYGTEQETLYPGVHAVMPGIETVQLYNTRDQLFVTALDDKKKETLKVQTQEGLSAALAIEVRYRLEARRLPYINANLPQPVEAEMVGPAISTAFREIAPHYLVREIFSTKRDQLRKEAAGRITAKLASDGIDVREVVLRDIQLPAEYARGLEGLLVKEQENERMNI